MIDSLQRTQRKDRLRRILGVCQNMGVLSHDEEASYHGKRETYRITDVRPTEQVVLTPRWEKYGLIVAPRVLSKVAKMGKHFAYALGVPRVNVEVDGDTVYICVPREQGEGAPLLFEQAWALRPNLPHGALLLGVDDDGRQLVIDITSPSVAHISVTGATGSGKSTLMKTMILSAQMAQRRVAILDISKGLAVLGGHNSVWRGGAFVRAADCAMALAYLAASMTEETADIPRPLAIFVDEAPELIRQRPEAASSIAALAAMGRQNGLHLILGAQHPLAADLGPTTMRNIPARITGKVADKGAAYTVTGIADSGAELLRGGGDMIVVVSGNRVHFQAAMPSAEMLASWAKRYPPRAPNLSGMASADIMSSRGSRGGSVVEKIPAAILSRIRRYYRQNRQPPSGQWVRKLSRSMACTGYQEFNALKAKRAIWEALRPAGIEYDGYDPSCQESVVCWNEGERV